MQLISIKKQLRNEIHIKTAAFNIKIVEFKIKIVGFIIKLFDFNIKVVGFIIKVVDFNIKVVEHKRSIKNCFI